MGESNHTYENARALLESPRREATRPKSQTWFLNWPQQDRNFEVQRSFMNSLAASHPLFLELAEINLQTNKSSDEEDQGDPDADDSIDDNADDDVDDDVDDDDDDGADNDADADADADADGNDNDNDTDNDTGNDTGNDHDNDHDNDNDTGNDYDDDNNHDVDNNHDDADDNADDNADGHDNSDTDDKAENNTDADGNTADGNANDSADDNADDSDDNTDDITDTNGNFNANADTVDNADADADNNDNDNDNADDDDDDDDYDIQSRSLCTQPLPVEKDAKHICGETESHASESEEDYEFQKKLPDARARLRFLLGLASEHSDISDEDPEDSSEEANSLPTSKEPPYDHSNLSSDGLDSELPGAKKRQLENVENDQEVSPATAGCLTRSMMAPVSAIRRLALPRTRKGLLESDDDDQEVIAPIYARCQTRSMMKMTKEKKKAQSTKKRAQTRSPKKMTNKKTKAQRTKKRTLPSTQSEIPGAEEAERSDMLYEWSKESFCNMPNVRPKEAIKALKAVGHPYGLQEVTSKLREMRDEEKWTDSGLFEVHIGMEVRKMFEGEYHTGKVTEETNMVVEDGEEESVKMWKVTYDDGDEEDMEWHELLLCHQWRSRIPAPCGGRQLQGLELFCGRGVVAQELFSRKWKVISIDNSAMSNATLKVDIRDIILQDLEFVPDFVWASPPCQTYSRLAGGTHRSIVDGELDRSSQAREHNFFFAKMTEIMYWAEGKHPHLIVVIENPVGMLKDMPLMKEFEEKFRLYSTTVDYCAFGRDEKKPTMLWTNDFALKNRLARFRCSLMCPVGRLAGNKNNGVRCVHAGNVRRDGSIQDFSVIPQALAEEVADYVDARFVLDMVRWKKAADPADDDHH